MTAYLDASVVVPLLVDEAGSPAAVDFINNHEGDLLLSDFAAAEVASAISRLLRIRELDLSRAKLALDDFDRLRSRVLSPVEVRSDDVSRADALVRRFDLELRAPDAIHVAFAERLGVTLVTSDQKMGAAALAVGLALIRPG